MKPTPLTDALLAAQKNQNPFYWSGLETALVEHARRLERDRAGLMEALEAVIAIVPSYILIPHPVTRVYDDGALVDGGTKEYPRFVQNVEIARAALAQAREPI